MTRSTAHRRARRLRLPSPAMVVACLALLVAAAGTGTAATIIITSSNQVKDGSLTGADIKNKSLGTADLTSSAVTALKGQTGPKGEKGDKGDAGPSDASAAVRNGVSPPALAANATTTIATRGGLAIGKYVIIARVDFDDVSGSPRNVTCRLEAGGATEVETIGVPGVAAGGFSGCSLILPVELTAAGSAVLKIQTPVASSVRVGDAKVVAIHVGSLDVNVVSG